MKEQKNNVSVVIYPNSYGMGYVVCESPEEIVTYGMGRMKKLKKDFYLKRLDKFIKRYNPNLVILKGYEKKNNGISKRVKSAIDRLQLEAVKRDVKVYRYTRTEIREAFEQFECWNKYSITKKLITWHGELERIQPKKRLNSMSEDYSMGIFDAFALMHTHYIINDPVIKYEAETN